MEAIKYEVDAGGKKHETEKRQTPDNLKKDRRKKKYVAREARVTEDRQRHGAMIGKRQVERNRKMDNKMTGRRKERLTKKGRKW